MLKCKSRGGSLSRVQYLVMFSVWHADQWPADVAIHFSKDPKHVTMQYRWQGSPLSGRDCKQQWLYSGWSATGTFLWMGIERNGGLRGERWLTWQSVGSEPSDPWPMELGHNGSVCHCFSTPSFYAYTLKHPESWHVGQWVDGLEI